MNFKKRKKNFDSLDSDRATKKRKIDFRSALQDSNEKKLKSLKFDDISMNESSFSEEKDRDIFDLDKSN